MQSQIFVNEHIDFKKEPIWFGQGKNVLRTDYVIEPVIDKFTELLIGKYWRWTDFNYDQDAIDYATKLTKEQKWLFDQNFKVQTLADSIISRTASQLFAPLTNIPALEKWFNVFQFNENFIHSDTYGAVLKLIKSKDKGNASEVFDDIMHNKQIINRIKYIAEIFDKLFELNLEYFKTGKATEEHKKYLALAWHGQYILETIIFQNSFIITFLFDQNDLMKNNSKAINAIYIDELIHGAFDKYIIKNYLDVDVEVDELYKTAWEIEQQWTDYLFSVDHKLPGCTKQAITEFNNYKLISMAVAWFKLKNGKRGTETQQTEEGKR